MIDDILPQKDYGYNTAQREFPSPSYGKKLGDCFSFSFALFDRKHELFNLGKHQTKQQVVEPEWFLDLLDCLHEISCKKITDLKGGTYDLHPIDWKTANTKRPSQYREEDEFYQFRISKSKGRVIGIKVDDIFYIVWLDRHHNLTNSEGYGKEKYYKPPPCLYEINEMKIAKLESDLREYEQIICKDCPSNPGNLKKNSK